MLKSRARQTAGGFFPYLLLGSARCLIQPFQAFTGNRIVFVVPEKGRSCFFLSLPLSCGHHPTAFRVIPFFRRSSIVPAANAVLLICIPPAQHRIFSLAGIPEHSHVCSTGHCHEYPHGFSPMQAFRPLPQPEASVSQSG